MAVNNIATGLRNTIVDAISAAIDNGATDPGGDIDIYTAAFATLLVSPTFGSDSFAAASSGSASANAVTDGTAGNTGTAAVVRFTDRTNATVFEGTVSTSGAEVNLNTTSINTSDVVSITSGTLTMPAS